MNKEKRNHQRVKTIGLAAGIVINNDSNNQEISLDAEILDISYTGIRVKLKLPIATEISGRIRITMLLPESKTPFTVHGILKHQSNDQECGLHYIDHVEGSIDDLMFECIELDSSTVFIRTQ